MTKRSSFLLIIITLVFSLTNAQDEYKDYNLKAPLDIPLFLSGNFAELRGHHFHAGIDFKTQGQVGLPIYAPANGYVSRIKMSTTGYGRALYIDHPELNLTTVYGHLNAYAPNIDSIVKDKHYELEQYNIDFFLGKEMIEVQKGQLIAYGGNTGSSAGPHLHFETRERSTQDPLNPLLFGFDVKDTKAPNIDGLRIYPVNGSVEKNVIDSKFYPLSYYNSEYHLKSLPKVEVWGEIGFAVCTKDYLDGSWNKCGIYSIELSVDSQTIFKQEMDRVPYSEMRYIDAHIDQEVRRKSRVDYQYSFKAKPNNPLSIYKSDINNGVFDFSDEQNHNVEYIIKDTYGNTSKLSFEVQSRRSSIQKKIEIDSVALYTWEDRHLISNNIFRLDIPAKAMYEDQHISYTCKSDSQYYAPIINIDNNERLLNKKATISIRPYKNDTVTLDKMVICSIAKNGKHYFLPSELKDSILQGSVYNLGQFSVTVDTIAPTLSPVNIYNNKKFTNKATFGFNVKDDFTGLWDFSATIDGKWALFFYEYKKDYIFYTIDPSRLEKGKNHTLKFKAWDATNNLTEYNCNFFW